ncbi:MAG: hypothetical protein K1X57_02505 [Gemmataceae bacterium]|nr:hypothetical protein [Gemmataceae bacterium]
MTGADWIELLRAFPPEKQSELNLMSRAGIEFSIDSILRTELTYICFRGRIVGNTDEGRVFFTPYDEIASIYINRYVREDEVNQIFAPTASSVSAAATTSGIEDTESVFSQLMGVSPPTGVPTTFVPTPTLIPPVPGTGSGLIPRVPGVSAARQSGPMGSGPIGVPGPSPPPAAAKASGLIPPPVASGTELPQPKGSILERLRAQRGAGQKNGGG